MQRPRPNSSVMKKRYGRYERPGRTGRGLAARRGDCDADQRARPVRPSDPRTLYDGAEDSLDGDLVFSSDGKWLFYARQTRQFSNDGVHVLDVSDAQNPRLASYQPGGGTFRIDYYRSGDAEYVIVLDAVDGLVINRFVRETGALHG